MNALRRESSPNSRRDTLTGSGFTLTILRSCKKLWGTSKSGGSTPAGGMYADAGSEWSLV